MQSNGRWPFYDEDEIDAVVSVLRSGKVNYWTGPDCDAFEKAYANYVGVAHAIANANGTTALDLALHALGIGEGDDVVVTPRTFIASASSVVTSGAQPIFADVDRESQNITAETIEPVLTETTKAVICVHLAGWPCDMDDIHTLCDARDISIIEDCAQAHGARYKGREVGSLSDIAAFSFCQDKIISTGGEGGMVVTDDPDLWRTMWSYKDHGKDWDAVKNREHPPGFRWLHEHFGTNWRMTGMQAAIGLKQLEKLPAWIEQRRANAAILTEILRGIPAIRLAEPPAHVEHAYYKFYAFLEPSRLKPDWTRLRIMDQLSRVGIPGLSGSCSEIYLEKSFEKAGLQPPAPLRIAHELGETSLMLPVHPTLSPVEVERMASGLRDVLIEASR